MLFISNVPVVIEPGVAALEADLMINAKEGERRVLMQLVRVPLDEKTAADLPFIPTVKMPHVFTPVADLKKTTTLVTYDYLGRLDAIYTKTAGAWERNDAADEHAGKTVTQFSVRLCFNSVKSLNKFLSAMGHLVTCFGQEKTPDPAAVQDISKLLHKSRVAPVVLPVAVAKAKMENVRL